MQISRELTEKNLEVPVKGVREMNEEMTKPLSQETSGQSDLDADALLNGPGATPFSKLIYHLTRAEDEAAEAQMADDIEWILMPTLQSIRGREQTFQAIKAFWMSVRERKPELLNNVANRDWGVFEYWNIGVVDEEVLEIARATWGPLPSDISSIVGQTYKMPVCFVYRINTEGKVDLVREYLDPATFIRELLRPGG
jgi:hypothetical protein